MTSRGGYFERPFYVLLSLYIGKIGMVSATGYTVAEVGFLQRSYMAGLLVQKVHDLTQVFGSVNFKSVNDTYGHDAGDEVLKYIAKLLKEKSRSTSFISRWGGEEFLLVFPDCNGDNAYIALERLRNTIQNSVIKVGNQEIQVTMTFGLTEFGYDKDEEAAIKEADEKLYMGKQNGRNQVVY